MMKKERASGVKKWRMYYPNGCFDPDFALVKFPALKGNYYHGLKNFDFDVV